MLSCRRMSSDVSSPDKASFPASLSLIELMPDTIVAMAGVDVRCVGCGRGWLRWKVNSRATNAMYAIEATKLNQLFRVHGRRTICDQELVLFYKNYIITSIRLKLWSVSWSRLFYCIIYTRVCCCS